MPPRPTKRARNAKVEEEMSSVNGNVIEDTTQPPPPPEDDAAAPPPPASPPPPPPEDGGEEGAQPPPPPMPPLSPPPPPEIEAAEEAEERERKRRKLEELERMDSEGAQDAAYWERIAKEKEAELKAENERKAATLYLDSISRQHLDFDFERVCSVSLSPLHVYACLVCGKYFQGRGPRSWASKHAMDLDHRPFLKISSEPGDASTKGNVYILPEGTQLKDAKSLAALSDIQYLLEPTFTEQQIRRLDAPDKRDSVDLQSRRYKPGFIGLNNLGGNDYINVVIQALAHVKPLRDFLIRGRAEPVGAQNGAAPKAGFAGLDPYSTTELAARFSMLVRKIWNPRLFKPQVSPHELLQEVNKASKGKFKLTAQGDPVEFLGWFLNQLHMDLGGGRKRESIVSATFRGMVRVESQKVFVRSGIELEDDAADKLDQDGRKEGGQEDAQGKAKFNIDKEIQTAISPFFLLAIDLPPPPVFQDVIEKNIIPQVPLAQLISKYDGVTFQEARGMIRRYKVLRLPPFVILHYRRFTKNNFVEERNPTIVNFPVKSLDLGETVQGEQNPDISTMYDLVANITHEATAGTVRDNQVWRVQVHTRLDGEPTGAPSTNAAKKKGKVKRDGGVKKEDDEDEYEEEEGADEEEKWFQIQDLFVEEINRQMIFLGETYIQIWERKDGSKEVSQLMQRIAAKQQADEKRGKDAPTNGKARVASKA